MLGVIKIVIPKYIKMKTRLLTFLLFIFFLACKNNEISPGPTVTFIDEPGLPEVTRLFVPLARSVWDIALNDEARAVVYQEVDKQFDGDYNVLLKTLVHSGQGENRTIEKEALTMLKARIDDFNVGAKETVFPQIFIPFFEKLKEDNLLGKKEPLLVFRDGPPAKNGLYRGYAFIDGKLADKGLISEKHASENEVWVISVNERVNDNGGVLPAYNINTNYGGRPQSYYNPSVKSIQIKGKGCMKEDWISGAAEVSLTKRVVFNYFDPTDYLEYLDDPWGTGQFKRDHIKSVCRKCAKNKDVYTFSDTYLIMVPSWLEPTSSYYPFQAAEAVLFEWDPWPAGEGKGGYYISEIKYRSYEDAWATLPFTQGDNSYRLNTPCIDFQLQ